MWQFHTVYPILTNTFDSTGAPLYMHHPLGVFWSTALLFRIFGQASWVVRLPAVVYSTLTPFLLYRIGRSIWGPIEGALTAIAYVSLPITLGFSNFHALEGPVIFSVALTIWGTLRYLQTWRGRYAFFAGVGFVWALNNDWIAYVWGGIFLAWVFVRGFVLPASLVGETRARPLARFWGLLCGAAVLSAVLAITMLMSTERLSDLLGAYSFRVSGNSMPLAQVLRTRHVWIELMFPGLAILLGKLALPVILVRAVRRRRDGEVLVLSILVMALWQYLHFKEGADVHIFWPQYFAPYFALGVGALCAGVRELLPWLAWHWPSRLTRWAASRRALIAALVVGLPVAAVFKDGASMIRLARETGGRFNSPMLQSDIDKVVAVKWFVSRFPERESVGMHPGVNAHWGWHWELRPHPIVRQQPPGTAASAGIARLYVMDTRYASLEEIKQAAATFHVFAVGPYWLIDRRAPVAPLDGFSFDEREPSVWAWYWQGGTEPLRTVRPDPWVTWEWRTLLHQAAPVPTGTPQTLEQVRIAHNISVTLKDAAGAARWLGELQRRLNVRVTAHYDNGAELLGVDYHGGAERSLNLYFLGGAFRGHAKFSIAAHVDRPPRLSTLAFDESEIEIAHPPAVPTELWQAGLIYSVKTPYRKRPGQERFFGRFTPLDGKPCPARVGGPRTVDLVTVGGWF
jgi:4-amino-4-deoxy-L-arabinose transferase-like glycosyltransferase